jgi:putative colanic acid biosynthesis UDP-glucose lipid carrier transferase
MQTRYLYILRLIIGLSDLVLINFCLLLSFYLSNHYGKPIEVSFYKDCFFTSSSLWLLTSGINGLYSEYTIYKLDYIYRATWKSICLHGFFFIIFLFLKDHVDSLRYLILSFYGLLGAGFLLSRFVGTALEERFKRHFDIRKPVAVLGRNRGGLKLASYLEKQGSFNFMGFIGEEGYHVDSNGNLLPGAEVQLEKAAHSGIKEVFVSLTPDRMDEVGYLLKEAEKQCIRLKFVPDLTSTISVPFNIEHMGGFSIMSARVEPLEDMKNRFKKRIFDIVFSSFVILFILSWLYPIIALLIKLENSGPVIFKQLRSGRNNAQFWCYKFRSMHVNNDKKQATKDDSRITRLGRFIRKTNIDELPQFFNVLLGNMSIIGPRPHMVEHTEQYSAIIDQYMVRQFLKPGISGWAQVKGYRGETKEAYQMEKRVEHDIWYMEHWSTMLDIRIVFMTIINVLKGEENAY